MENRESKYVNLLTDEDIREILDICFYNFGTVKSKKVGNYFEGVTVKSEKEQTCKMNDFYIQADADKAHGVKHYHTVYLKYMYEKFGKQYLLDRFDWVHHLESLKEERDAAERKYQEAKRKADLNMEELLKSFEQLD